MINIATKIEFDEFFKVLAAEKPLSVFHDKAIAKGVELIDEMRHVWVPVIERRDGKRYLVGHKRVRRKRV